MNKKILGFLGGIAAGTAVNHFLDENLVGGNCGKGIAVSAAASTIAIGVWCMSTKGEAMPATALPETTPAPKELSGLGNMRNMSAQKISRSLVDEKLAEILAAKKKNGTPLTEAQKRGRLNDMLNGAKPKNITG